MPYLSPLSKIADKLILLSASFSILLLSTFAACGKKDIFAPPAFPAATQTGANTMAAVVNNKQFIVYELPGSVRASLISSYVDHIFTLSGDDPSTEFSGLITINLYNINGTGSYELMNQNGFRGNNWAQLGLANTAGQFHYLTDSVHTGTVTITRFDTINHIISGTFIMMPKLYTGSSSDTTAIVNNGRFDVTYQLPH